MATEETPSFDDLDPVEDPGTDTEDDAEWIELEPGESIVGELRSVRPNCGDYDTTVLEIARGLGDTVLMWSNGQIDRKLGHNDLGEGDVVGIRRTEETFTFENAEGEEQEANVWEVRTIGDD